MTRQEFIDLLATQWPDVPLILEHLSLVRLTNHLAVDAFIRGLQGPAVDALREQVRRIQDGESFGFTEG